MYSSHNSSGTLIFTLFGATISAAVVWFWPDLMGPDRTTAIAQPSLQTEATQLNSTAIGDSDKPVINARIDEDAKEVVAPGFDPDSIPLWPHATKYSELGEFVPTSEIMRKSLDYPHSCVLYSETTEDCEVVTTSHYNQPTIAAEASMMLSDYPIVFLTMFGSLFIHDGLVCRDAEKMDFKLEDLGRLPQQAKSQIKVKFREHLIRQGRKCTAYFKKDGVYWAQTVNMQGEVVDDSPPLPFVFMREKPPLRFPHQMHWLAEQARAGKEI